MRKILMLFLTLGILFTLAACGNTAKESADDTTDVIEEEAEEETEIIDKSDETESEEEAEEISTAKTTNNAKEGKAGIGEEFLSTGFFDITVPDGIQYEICDYNVDLKTHTGKVAISMGEKNTLGMYILATTTRTVSSIDEAITEFLYSKAQEDYENTSCEELDPVSFNGTKYRVFKLTSEDNETTNLISYYRDTKTETDMYIEIELNGTDINTEYVQTALNTIIYR